MVPEEAIPQNLSRSLKKELQNEEIQNEGQARCASWTPGMIRVFEAFSTA